MNIEKCLIIKKFIKLNGNGNEKLLSGNKVCCCFIKIMYNWKVFNKIDYIVVVIIIDMIKIIWI